MKKLAPDRIEELAKDLRKQFADGFVLHTLDSGNVSIQLPVYFLDGDSYQIYLSQDELTGMLVVSDMGHTLMQYSYDEDVSLLLDNGSRAKLLQSIIEEGGMSIMNGVIGKLTRPTRLPEDILQLVQTITRVMDINFLTRERVKDTFMEDLSKVLHIIFPDIQEDYEDKRIDRAELYPIDFALNDRPQPIYIFGANNGPKARLSALVIEHLKSQHVQFRSIGVVPSLESKIIPQKDLTRFLRAINTPIIGLDSKQDFRDRVAELEPV